MCHATNIPQLTLLRDHVLSCRRSYDESDEEEDLPLVFPEQDPVEESDFVEESTPGGEEPGITNNINVVNVVSDEYAHSAFQFEYISRESLNQIISPITDKPDMEKNMFQFFKRNRR